MLDGLRQFFANLKMKRTFKKAVRILTALNYEVVDEDDKTNTLAFTFGEDSVALFIADDSTLGNRLEATILFAADILNLKLMSDIAMLAYRHRCSSSGVVNAGSGKAKIELAFYMGEAALKRKDLAVAITYIRTCIQAVGARLMEKSGAVSTFKFDMSMFDDEKIPFFDPQLVGERKEYAHGDWESYLQSVANHQAVAAYSADVEHSLDVVLACRDFENLNNVALVEVGDAVMVELARHRNNKAAPEDKKKIN